MSKYAKGKITCLYQRWGEKTVINLLLPKTVGNSLKHINLKQFKIYSIAYHAASGLSRWQTINWQKKSLKNINFKNKFHDDIWHHNEKRIEISTNMPGINVVYREIGQAVRFDTCQGEHNLTSWNLCGFTCVRLFTLIIFKNYE